LLSGAVCWLPIAILAWILPFTNPLFLTSFEVFRGSTLYVFLMFIFATIIQYGHGAPFYKGAFRSVQSGSANMDVLVVLGTTSAWCYGTVLILLGHDQVHKMQFENEAARTEYHMKVIMM
jgi:cation transport ATPase